MSEALPIGVLGTGHVGQTIAARLAELGHSVCIGTRDPAATLARATPDGFGNPPFRVWSEQHPQVKVGTLPQAATHGKIIFNATSGANSLEALRAAGENNLDGKVLVDLANPLDFSKGAPPTLSTCNTDSLGEQIQRAFPNVHVVKTLNTVTASLMVQPALVAGAEHTIFLSGNSAPAKAQVTGLLRSFGWKDILDLGDISTARGPEMLLPLWLRIWGATKTPLFSVKVVR